MSKGIRLIIIRRREKPEKEMTGRNYNTFLYYAITYTCFFFQSTLITVQAIQRSLVGIPFLTYFAVTDFLSSPSFLSLPVFYAKVGWGRKYHFCCSL
jgi:hypothetical protein